MQNLNVNKREKTNAQSASKLRKKGLVPGVLYGKKLGNLLFEIGEMELGREFTSGGEHGLVNVNCDGESYDALIKDVQRDPVTHKVIHLDLEAIDGDKKVTSEVPIHFIGEEWIANKGQILQKEKGVVKVSCAANKLPKSFSVDVSSAHSGSVYRYCDLEVGGEISIIDDLETVIAAVSNESRLNAQLAEEEKEEAKA
ncbi:MAG: 50S ribosomal protein L25 [Clostridium sp.]